MNFKLKALERFERALQEWKWLTRATVCHQKVSTDWTENCLKQPEVPSRHEYARVSSYLCRAVQKVLACGYQEMKSQMKC